MHFQTTVSALAATPLLSYALAISSSHERLLPRNTISASQLEAIAPTSKTCAGAAHPSECRTASQALSPIIESLNTYSIATAGAQAAIISTIAFESGDFKYSVHYFPAPVPGQGTRNMQSAAYNAEYAQSLQLSAAQAGPAGVLDALVANETYDFGSAAWFLDTQCAPAVKAGLATGGMDGFMAYLGCIQTDMTDDRKAYWQRANAALGVQSSG